MYLLKLIFLFLYNIYSMGHELKNSPWPFFCFLSSVLLFTEFVIFFSSWSSFYSMFFSFLMISYISMLWWKDVSYEGQGGEYSPLVQDGLKSSMMLFIFSEVCFFGSFFWTFFHSSLSPNVEIGVMWPPFSLVVFNPFHIPLLNTLILLGSGATVTWSHHNLMGGAEFKTSLLATIFLGLFFLSIQSFEYYSAGFTISDSVYGSIFFMATGFHGIHVLVGTAFLIVVFFRSNIFNSFFFLGYELAIWYWHFVDVVWIFLFSFIYWWGC